MVGLSRFAWPTYFLNMASTQEIVICSWVRLEISNNRAERSIKPFVMGRKNFLFANTPRGAKASAVLYSILETAKANGLDPYRYLLFLFEELPGMDKSSDDWVAPLLPWNAPDRCKSNPAAQKG